MQEKSILKFLSKSCLNVLNGLVIAVCLLLSTEVSAQFTITDNFRGNSSHGIILGGSPSPAKLTSGDEDPVDAGWLRLTADKADQSGFAYVDQSFPSSMGVVIDFEYTMWRTMRDRTYWGADGMSIFLFDAKYGATGSNPFRIGFYGGSLGYANLNISGHAKNQDGLHGGYLGIGFDSYGNFSAATEGKIGGARKESPNSISFRGPTRIGDRINTNKYLTGVSILSKNNSSSNDGVDTDGNGAIVDATSLRGNGRHNVIDYNQEVSVRPTYEQFYRRVRIEITPTSTGKYDISLRWATSFGGALRELIKYETTDVPPALLKVGFAASTGGGWNNHDIRNLLITTPGNLRVLKRGNVDILRSIPRKNATEPSNEIEYQIEVINDTGAALKDIDFSDQLTDALGNVIPVGVFDITSITHTGFEVSGTSLPTASITEPIRNASFQGKLHLKARSTGVIIVKGTLNAMPAGNILNNTSSAYAASILDEDLLNNTSSVRTPVVSEKSDLVLTNAVEPACLNAVQGNPFNLKVSNIGILPLNFGNNTETNHLRVEVKTPSGVVQNSNGRVHEGWTRVETGNVASGFTYSYTRTTSGVLYSGKSLPPIIFNLNADQGYKVSMKVISEVEPSENLGNNTYEVTVSGKPSAPEVPKTPIYYCYGATALPLEAQATDNNILLWYLNIGGTSSDIPFTPITSKVGETTYYVTQLAPGGCESSPTEIKVIVNQKTTAGELDFYPGYICMGSKPNLIRSIDSGTGDGTITYRWELSIDGGETWESIEGATEADYQPIKLNKTTFFRRITRATREITCESVPTNEVMILVNNCKSISNPMIYQRVKFKEPWRPPM